ncbi:MAG TPA: hypothetical protein VMQ78_05115 [Candidatus Limnocylindria bacterium]|nr:hypothetical protein [Candidatus Limnocylindria bacterium]
MILAGLVGFQLLLAAGLPLGHYAWGGAHQVLPRLLRVGSVVATFIYVLTALIILEAANVTDLVASELPRAAVWVLAGFFAIGVVMNAMSRSERERRMAFVALSLGTLCVVVATRAVRATPSHRNAVSAAFASICDPPRPAEGALNGDASYDGIVIGLFRAFARPSVARRSTPQREPVVGVARIHRR